MEAEQAEVKVVVAPPRNYTNRQIKQWMEEVARGKYEVDAGRRIMGNAGWNEFLVNPNYPRYLADAKASAVGRVQEALFKKAFVGQITPARMILESHWPEKYGRKALEVKITQGLDMKTLSALAQMHRNPPEIQTLDVTPALPCASQDG